MITISLCLIVKNEEQVLPHCLEAVGPVVDEIIVVDTGSTDATKEVARRYGARVWDFEWCDDFSKARNFAFEQASKEYILWLDADDEVTPENAEKLLQLKETLDGSVDAVSMHYSLARDSEGYTTYSLRRNRLVKKSMGFKWIGHVHEYLEVYGHIIHPEITINHAKTGVHTDRNLKIFRAQKQKGEPFSDRDCFYFANELYYNGCYEEAIQVYHDFIEKGVGWIEDLKTAAVNLIDCYTFTNQEDLKIDVILKTIPWGVPRADLCCRLAEYFFNQSKYESAIFWYKVASGCTPHTDHMGIDPRDYYTWIPYIQLCVCYANIEDYETAYYYNEMAALYVQDSPKIKHNRTFLKGKMEALGIREPMLEKSLVKREIRFI